jgi:hypothetical protein
VHAVRVNATAMIAKRLTIRFIRLTSSNTIITVLPFFPAAWILAKA